MHMAARQVTSEDVEKSDKVPVVLRVKRKRTDDPAESLVVKKLRRLDSSVAPQCDGPSVFHFVGTFPKQEISQTEVLDRIKSQKATDHSLLVKKNPFSALTISEKQEGRRERKKTSSQGHRFKLVSKHRQLKDSEAQDDDPSVATSSGDTTSAKELMAEMVHLYDVVQEDSPQELGTDTARVKSKSRSKGSGSEETSGHHRKGLEGMEAAASVAHGPREGAITCNSTEMVREKCSSSNGIESDYVYDLYYARDYEGRGTVVDFYDWDSLCVHDGRYDIELFNYDLFHPTPFTSCDDEDDSNDEDNWRNDYPDEEDLFQSDSDEEGAHSRSAYRYRDTCEDYIFDANQDPYQEDTSYWKRLEGDHDPISSW